MAVQHNHAPMRIARIWDECEGVRGFEFDGEVNARAGQFAMLLDPESSENPLTVSYDSPLRVIVKRVGGDDSFTSRMFRKKPGDTLQVTGPMGNRLADMADMDRPLYAVMGGCGYAGLPLLVKEAKGMGKPVWYVFGFNGRGSVPEAVRALPQHYQTIATMDGSVGLRGDILEAIQATDFAKDAQAVVCGPRKMLVAAAEKLAERLRPEDIIISLEPYMKCGRGVCGSCEIAGYHACTDGPNFRYPAIRDAEDFMGYRRGPSGALEPL